MMVDRERAAGFLSVARSAVPTSPDDPPDPKQTLVDLARRSRGKAVREGLVPRPRSGRRVGPDYTSLMIEYVEERWRPHVAATSSDSLRRCMVSLKDLAERKS